MHIEVQHSNNVFFSQVDSIETLAGRTPKDFVAIGTELLGSAPADTDAALVALAAAGYTVRVGDDNSILY